MNEPRLIALDLCDRSRAKTWSFAAAFALCGHLAFAVFAIGQMREEPDDDLGAPGIEVALDLASAQIPVSDLPPGPDSDASAASAAVAPQKTEVKETDRPQETPVEAENPDRLVAQEAPKVPEEEQPEVKAQSAKPSEESVAHEATAPPALPNAPEAPQSKTRDPGTGESLQRARVTWQRELLAHLSKYKRYPSERTHKSAQILVALDLDRAGHVVAASIVKSSGDAAFDKAAIAMIERANPVPAPPPAIADQGLTFSLPVIFRENGR